MKDFIKNKAPWFVSLFRKSRDIFCNLVPYRLRRNKNYGFHNDLVLQGLIKKIYEIFPVDSFLETGTYKGDTAIFIAHYMKRFPIFTCEINRKFFKESRWRLKKYKNVIISNDSSPEFFDKLLREGKAGKFPLIFLDAHADGFYWPLLDEIEIVSNRFPKAIIIIDDFIVPGESQFGFDFWTDGKTKIPYGMEAIAGRLSKISKYTFLYPKYSFKEAFAGLPQNAHDPLRGYIIIFKDAEEEFKTLSTWNGIKNYSISH